MTRDRDVKTEGNIVSDIRRPQPPDVIHVKDRAGSVHGSTSRSKTAGRSMPPCPTSPRMDKEFVHKNLIEKAPVHKAPIDKNPAAKDPAVRWAKKSDSSKQKKD